MLTSIVITTKNRKCELRNALKSVRRLNGAIEAVVIDDGSTDGTAEMLRSEFPWVRAVVHAESKGLVVRRNEGARIASGEVIVSIDDDAEFSSERTVVQTLAFFASERIGAVAIPYIDVNRSEVVRQKAPDADGIHLTDTFIGTAHAVRRHLFNSLGGYREELVHQGEERDFCIRMAEAGYLVRLGAADPIHHFESPKRDFRRMDLFGPRNAILFAWQNVPILALPLHIAVSTLRCMLWTLDPERLAVRVRGLAMGYLACASTQRRPVRWSTYRLTRRLGRPGALTMEEADPLMGARSMRGL